VSKPTMTQRDMVMELYRVVIGDGDNGVARQVRRINDVLPTLMPRSECQAVHKAQTNGADRRFEKRRGVLAVLIPAAMLVVSIVGWLLK
jgi:hypothetical protein